MRKAKAGFPWNARGMHCQALHCPGETELFIFTLQGSVQVAAGVLARIMDAAEQPSASFEVWLQCIEWL